MADPSAVDPGIRQHFLDELRLAVPLPEDGESDRLLAAFGAVPREAHVAAGPWRIVPRWGRTAFRTPDDDPRWLYHDALVALDEERGINIGEPSLWARMFHRIAVPEASRILQVGAGSGYFTAVLAQLAGPGGSVVGCEVEPHLAAIAERALSDLPNARVECRDAVASTPDGPFDLVISFAGATHLPASWIAALGPGGRILLPVTGSGGWGAFMLLTRRSEGVFSARALGRCGFYPCIGARDDDLAEDIDTFWRATGATDEWRGALVRANGDTPREALDWPDGWRLVGDADAGAYLQSRSRA